MSEKETAEKSGESPKPAPSGNNPEPDGRLVLAILTLIAVFALVGGFFLRGVGDQTKFIPEQKVKTDGGVSREGVVRDGRYIGYLVSFRVPAGASAVQGGSDGYSETVSWQNSDGRGDLSAIPLLPGETLRDIAKSSGIDPEIKDIKGRPALVDIARLRGVWVAQAQTLAGEYKVSISNISADRTRAAAGAEGIVASLAPRRG